MPNTPANTDTSSANRTTAAATHSVPTLAFRYDAQRANAIETKWQGRWDADATFASPNPGDPGFDAAAYQGKRYILDMFPYPSGVGLHVGHPLGYIATDIYARYLRAQGYHVLHAMGFDAFGLPAEQFAVEHGVHPRITTENNVASMKKQLRRLGLAHDPQRSFSTTDVDYYRWTQWIFLQIYNSWYDRAADRARPIAELMAEYASGKRSCADEADNPQGKAWGDLDAAAQREIINAHRLCYRAAVPVNWCPALGTVLANEEVTADGTSERGNHPVYKRPLKQWMMRITEYTERLLGDLEPLAWPEPIKIMQRNWIGRSEGAQVQFKLADAAPSAAQIEIFTTRPDTLFGATYMVLAPEHPLVAEITTEENRAAVEQYQREAQTRSDVDRMVENREKTGVFTGAYAINPVNEKQVPIWIADYVMMGYGTGAIMAVPAHDKRDHEFAVKFELPIVQVVQPENSDEDWVGYTGNGRNVNSAHGDLSLNELKTPAAKAQIIEWLNTTGQGAAQIQYKLRDWLFSRQRYWGEPFPILLDEDDQVVPLTEADLPVALPPLDNFTPKSSDDPEAVPEPPLSRADDWVNVEIDGKQYRRETNTMPQWAGSCWYYLRYLDRENKTSLVDPAIEKYWMLSNKKNATGTSTDFDADTHHSGGVDLYVGGAEHAVLHLLYARFWHKVLFDLGHVSTPEPFGRLFNQGYIQAYAYEDERRVNVPAEDVEERDGEYFYQGKAVTRSYGKMGKSLKNSVTPDEMCADYGCDTLRLYEMYMGPLEQSKPWNTRDAVGSFRFLQRVWRNFVNEETGELKVTTAPADAATLKKLHQTIAKVGADMHSLSFNTAIAALIELNNSLVQLAEIPRVVAEPMVKMLAPFVPHFAEELWSMLGHEGGRSVTFEAFPVADEKYLVEDEVQLVVQVMGKVRAKLMVPADIDQSGAEAVAQADPNIAKHLEGKTIRKIIYVPGRLINFVAN